MNGAGDTPASRTVVPIVPSKSTVSLLRTGTVQAGLSTTTVHALYLDLAVPACSYDVSYARGVVLVCLVHLHVQRCLSMSSIQAGYGQPHATERVPKPSGEWATLQAYSNRLGRFCHNDDGNRLRRRETFALPHRFPRAIDHAHMRGLLRYIQPNELLHARLHTRD